MYAYIYYIIYMYLDNLVSQRMNINIIQIPLTY
jgi:hypothetical protein